MATPAGPRPGNYPPNFNPNALSNKMQNLRINHQQANDSGGSGAPNRPSGPSPHIHEPPPFTGNRPRPPPQGPFPRGPPPPNAPSQTTLPSNMAGPRPDVPPPASRPPPPFASRPPPPSIGGPAAPPQFGSPRPGAIYPSQISAYGPVGNGTPDFTPGMPPGRPQFPPAMGGFPRPLAGPPQPQQLSSSGTSSQLPHMRPSFSSPPAGASPSMGQHAPPFSSALQNGPPPPGSPFSAPVQGMPQSSGSPYGMQTGPSKLQQGAPAPPIPGPMQQQQMFGMPPPPTSLPNHLSQSSQSRIELDQIPRLIPNTAVILHETRQNNQANPPPPATSEYIAKDTGNCSPRYIRCTLNQVPCTVDLLSRSAMQLALLVQPLALPHPSEEPIQSCPQLVLDLLLQEKRKTEL